MIKTPVAIKLEAGGIPESLAARFNSIMEFVSGLPIYCDCMEDCPKIVGYTKPLLTKEDAIKVLSEMDVK